MKTQVLGADDESLSLAADLLARGELVAFPTETERRCFRFLPPRAARRTIR